MCILSVTACLLAGAHYYCETLDISRPFPSERPPHQPSWAFVWNKALSMPFRNAGLDGPQTVCPALLQVGGGAAAAGGSGNPACCIGISLQWSKLA